MGLEQSHQGAPSLGVKNIRPASTSPRPSISSDSDLPYISYTVNKPIGESPKLQPKHAHHLRSVTPSPNPSPKPLRPRSMTGHNIVVVKEALAPEDTPETDPELCLLQTIPTFLPIMRGALSAPMLKDPEILDKLDYRSIHGLCLRYEEHLKLSAETVSAEQNSLAARIREIDFAIATLVNMMTERQKKYVKYSEKLNKVQEISTTLQKKPGFLKSHHRENGVVECPFTSR